MKYEIMRKNEMITVADFSEDGEMQSFEKVIDNIDIAPLQEQTDSMWLKKWWKSRTIPTKQGLIENILKSRGMESTEEFLLKNLGLSLTDYYWIRPIGSNLRWEDVNLYENAFQDNMLSVNWEPTQIHTFTPNSTLQGQLEKTWVIGKDNERYLLKGNRNEFSSESINEVIASELHRLQGYDNYTTYSLIKIKNKDYDYGCISKAFTSLNKELVSAYDIVTSEKKSNDISYLQHFINVCEKHGIDRKDLQRDLDYLIMTDFILSNRDRHLNNIGVLRDAETLKFIRLAPIYDTGKSLFVDTNIPMDDRALLSIATTSFTNTELGMLKYVKQRELVDIEKLPSSEFIREMYLLDTQMSQKQIELIVEAYEKKIKLFEQFQSGYDLNKIKATLTRTNPDIAQTEAIYISEETATYSVNNTFNINNLIIDETYLN